MENVLITGAAGFIGSHLCERMLGDPAPLGIPEHVIGFDNFIDTYDPAIKRRNLAASRKHERFTLIEGDIRDAAAVDLAFAHHKPALVVHIAALAGVRPSVENAAPFVDVNVTGTANVLDAAVRHGAKRIVFASSSSVYGDDSTPPFRETETAAAPVSPYAATKRAGELLAHAYWKVHGLPVTCLRFFTVYGPRQRPDLAIGKFMGLIDAGKPIPVFGDGATSRDYTYIDDIIDGVVRAAAYDGQFEIFNLGSHRPVSLSELIGHVEKVIGKKAIVDRKPMQPGDVMRTCADVIHSAERLGYNPRVSLEEGLRRQWEWMRVNVQ